MTYLSLSQRGKVLEILCKSAIYCSVHELTRQCPLWRKGTAGLDLLQRLAAARELGPNRFDGGGPHEGSRVLIPGLQELVNRRNQVGHAEERGATDALAGELSKPALDQIQPAGTGGDKVTNKPRVAREPRLHGRMLVGAVVVHHQMQSDLSGELCIQAPQEFQKLLMARPGCVRSSAWIWVLSSRHSTRA